MKKILVLSDTHIPRSAHDMPMEVYDAIAGVDMILHAGDFVEKDVLDKLKSLRQTIAVVGNMDSPALHHILNQKEVIEVEGVKIGMIHGYGAPVQLQEIVKGEFKNVDAIVFGHSHSALNIVEDGILFFNPGSPTDKIFASSNSYGILEVNDKKIEGHIIKL